MKFIKIHITFFCGIKAACEYSLMIYTDYFLQFYRARGINSTGKTSNRVF